MKAADIMTTAQHAVKTFIFNLIDDDDDFILLPLVFLFVFLNSLTVRPILDLQCPFFVRFNKSNPDPLSKNLSVPLDHENNY